MATKKFPRQLLIFLDDDGEGGTFVSIGSDKADPSDLIGLVENGARIARYGLLGVETFHNNPHLLKEDDGN